MTDVFKFLKTKPKDRKQASREEEEDAAAANVAETKLWRLILDAKRNGQNKSQVPGREKRGIATSLFFRDRKNKTYPDASPPLVHGIRLRKRGKNSLTRIFYLVLRVLFQHVLFFSFWEKKPWCLGVGQLRVCFGGSLQFAPSLS